MIKSQYRLFRVVFLQEIHIVLFNEYLKINSPSTAQRINEKQYFSSLMIFMNFCITCAAGLESILKKEIELAGYTVIGSQPTLIRFK